MTPEIKIRKKRRPVEEVTKKPSKEKKDHGQRRKKTVAASIIDIEKQLEEERLRREKAVVKIQSVWRGFLIRNNFRIILTSVIKMQGFARQIIARKEYSRLLKEKKEKLHQILLQESATKIQALWRGFYSRKHKFSYKDYQKIQSRNNTLKRSIQTINDLETALVTGHQDQDLELPLGFDISSLLQEDYCQLAESMGESRVAELYTYALRGGYHKVPLETFPIDGLITQTNEDQKVRSLKEAILLLHTQMKEREIKKLEKAHYLLRTSAQPGVFSDRRQTELTDIEKQLKSVKFWSAPKPPNLQNRAHPAKKIGGSGDGNLNDLMGNIVISKTLLKH